MILVVFVCNAVESLMRVPEYYSQQATSSYSANNNVFPASFDVIKWSNTKLTIVFHPRINYHNAKYIYHIVPSCYCEISLKLEGYS